MNALTDKYMQLIHAKWGAFVQWASGAIVGFIIAEAAKRGIELPPIVREFITETLTIGFAFIASFVVQWYQHVQNVKVQKAVGTEPDGWIGEETVQAAKS